MHYQLSENFEKILALNLFVMVCIKNQPQFSTGDPAKDKIINDLVNFLVTDLKWVKETPNWICLKSNHQKPGDGTSLSFLDKL